MPGIFRSSYRFRRQYSSGGILFRWGRSGPRVALISRKGGKIWCLPKGLLEPGESAPETALRETQEETGLTGRILQKVGDVTYWYLSKEEKTRFFKKVSFYLIQHTGGDIRKHDFEVDEVAWFPWGRAIEKLSFANERKLLEKARGLLQR